MECACIYVDNDEPPEFYNDEMRKAAKPHNCCECGKQIAIGETYEHVSGKWDGRFDTFNTCSVCLDLRSVFFCNGWEFTFLMEKLWEHIIESDGQISSDCILDLKPEAQAVVFGMIEKVWDEMDE